MNDWIASLRGGLAIDLHLRNMVNRKGGESMNRELTPLQIVLAFGAFVAAAVFVLLLYTTPRDPGNSAVASIGDEDVDLTIPDRQHSPVNVVTMQISAMRDSLQDPARLQTCYSLASPKNREFTGPYQRFAIMIMQPPYDLLATCKEWRVAAAAIENRDAAVLVTAHPSEGPALAFRFLLHQYEEAPFSDCWLTEGVDILPTAPERAEEEERALVTPNLSPE